MRMEHTDNGVVGDELLVIPRSDVGHRQRVAVLGQLENGIEMNHESGPLWTIPRIELNEGR